MGVVPETTEDIVVFLCVLVGSSLSVVGAGAQVGCMTFGRRYRKRYWRIVLGHALATLACHLSILVAVVYVLVHKSVVGLGCTMQGFTMQWMSNAPLCYVVAEALMLYWLVVHQQKISRVAEFFYHLLPWLVCPAVALVPLFHIGNTRYIDIGGWCWLPEDPFWAPLALSTAWLWSAVGLVFTVYLILFYLLRLEQKRRHEIALFEMSKGPIHYRQMVEIRKHLVLYPLAFMALSAPAVIDSALKTADAYWFPISLLHFGMMSLQGFVNFFVYFFTSGMAKAMKKWCCEDNDYGSGYSRIRLSTDSSHELASDIIID